jgi:ATP-binding cassette subfamily B protein/subfamily B ATP-binding cassette protein MsbA
VRFEGVSFGYEAGRPVLSGITLEGRPGETIALVGATGAGKSTLASLIPRFFDPWEGRVLVDGRDVRDVQLASLRSRVALVLQEPFLLPLTVAQNIAYGRPEAGREEIVAAAEAANAAEFIRRLPDGYETVLGERGATLSGGQRQRLAIARALLKDAPILILDEPTSALDAQTEALLLEALERLMAQRTTFIIAHRLSTIQAADRIAVLEAGRLVETGTHQELLSAQGFFSRYHRLQFPDCHREVAG